MEKEILKLDKNKIKEEDRRYLLSRHFNEVVANHQGSMHNTAITLSLLAILISTFTLVYQTKSLWVTIPYAILSSAGLIFYIRKLLRVQNNLLIEREKLRGEYDELFKYHFTYANKKGAN